MCYMKCLIDVNNKFWWNQMNFGAEKDDGFNKKALMKQRSIKQGVLWLQVAHCGTVDTYF